MKKCFFALVFVMSTFSLQAEDVTWSPPETLSSPMNDASEARVGIDSNGNIESLWIENGIVYSSSYPFGGNWSESISISNSGASDLSLVVDPNGNATAIWLEGTELVSKTKPSGQNWDPSVTLAASGASEPQIAMDESGNVVAIWTNNGFIESKTRLFGSNWQPLPDTLSASGSDTPRVSIGSGGKVVAVWHRLASQMDTIFSSNKTLSDGLWSAALAISSPAKKSLNPQVAVNSSGNAIAIWYIYTQTGGSFSEVYLQSSYLSSGGTWSLPVLVSNSEGFYDPSLLTAQVAFESGGTAVAVWRNSIDGSSFNIFSTILQPSGNGNWESPEIVLVERNVTSLAFDLNVPGSLDAFLSYMVFDGSVTSIHSVISNITAYQPNRWTFPDFLSQGNYNGFPQLAVTNNGSSIYAAAVWLQSLSPTVVQTSIGLGTILQPPSGLTVMQSSNNYGIFIEYYNTVSWEPSVSPNITSYLIFRDGLLIGEVLESTTSFIDNNREQNAATTYGIAAIDYKGTQSQVATVNFP